MIRGLFSPVKRGIGLSLTLLARESKGIQILRGPLRHRFLPLETARQNFQMLFGQYEIEVVRELLSLPEPGGVAYDIGAHLGYMTLALAECVGQVGQVFCFEPISQNIPFITELCSLNDLQQRAQVIPVALANTNGLEKMIALGSSSTHLLKAAVEDQKIDGCSETVVTTWTLDHFVFERSNPVPDVIKMDVEGAEALVIEGGLRTLERYMPKMIIEIHGPQNAQKLWRLLCDLSYSWWHLPPRRREAVSSEEHLLSFFSKYAWTHHLLLIRS